MKIFVHDRSTLESSYQHKEKHLFNNFQTGPYLSYIIFHKFFVLLKIIRKHFILTFMILVPPCLP